MSDPMTTPEPLKALRERAARCRTLFGGHSFVARYSIGAPALPNSVYEDPKFSAYDLEQLIRAAKPKIYCGDVCENCGAVANAQEQDNG